MKFNQELTKTIELCRIVEVPNDRQAVLQPLIKYIQNKLLAKAEVKLNFICTHNSRRSQFAQIWAQTAAYYFNINARCYSGGVEITAFNKRAVASIKRAGFKVSSQGKGNPVYSVLFSTEAAPIEMFSTLYDDSANPNQGFAAVMTCSHADKNCPLIPGTEARILVMYDDPKEFDGTPLESTKYDERLIQIASEMFFVFETISKKLS